MTTDADWNALLAYLPADWEDLASRHGALSRLRGFSSAEALLRTLLIHLAQGCSLRETAVRAQRGAIASVSDVAIMKRLRNAERWLLAMCQGLCADEGAGASARLARRWRLIAVDATCVSEPGSTGTNWKMHYALEMPSLSCAHFELTGAEGGERFDRFPLRAGDLALADRAYCTTRGIRSVRAKGAHALVRMKLSQTNFYEPGATQRFDFLAPAARLAENEVAQWEVILGTSPAKGVAGRLCVMRRPEEIAEMERTKIRREAKKKRRTVRARTLQAASFVGLFCTLPAAQPLRLALGAGGLPRQRHRPRRRPFAGAQQLPARHRRAPKETRPRPKAAKTAK